MYINTSGKAQSKVFFSNPVDTRRRFNVDTTSYDAVSMLKRLRVSTGKSRFNGDKSKSPTCDYST